MQQLILPHFEVKEISKICLIETNDKDLISTSINKSGLEAICHIDNSGRLTGITCDADLRKSSSEIINRDPQTIYEGSSQVGLVRDYIPVIDKDGVLKSVLFRPREQILRASKSPSMITIIGIGYVGLTLAISLAQKGLKVYCIDKNPELIDLLNLKKLPFYELGLEEAFDEAYPNLIFQNVGSKIYTSEVIVTVGTPLFSDKEVNLNYLYDAIDQIVEHSDSSQLKSIILRSTVPIGTCDILEAKLLKEYNQKVDFVMCPERTIEGKALYELASNPQIIGTYSIDAASVCYKLFSLLSQSIIISNNPKFAELSKLGDNAYRDILFAYSNFIALTAQHLNLVGSDVIESMNTGYIRNNLPSPSPGVGGPCLSKDAFIFNKGLEQIGLDSSPFITAGRLLDDSLIDYLADKIIGHCQELGINQVSIAGLAFKGHPETSDTRDSSTLKLIGKLSGYCKIFVYDPVVINDGNSLSYSFKPFEDFCTDSSVLVIMNNNRRFHSYDWDIALRSLAIQALVIDGWSILKRFNVSVEYNLIYRQL